jgi:signal recognition particle subunit SRP72
MGKAAAAGGAGEAGDATAAEADAAPRVEALFSALEEQLRGFAVHKALSTCDQILALAPGDADALCAKVAVCIHADQFGDALALLQAHPAVAALLPFEKAYCLYRSSRHKDALALLDDSPSIPPDRAAGAAHLRAQLQYRAGAFDECIRTYEAAMQARPAGVGCARACLRRTLRRDGR